MVRFPQVLVNIRVSDPSRLQDAKVVWEAVRRAEELLGDGGRVLVRPSGTEPLVRVMVEAETQGDAVRHADAIAEAVRSDLADG
jgi:phosphoglucosamine mutase